MKALVYTAVMETEIREVAAPEPGPGQVVVDLACCGLCGSDMHAWHGHDERRQPPLVLGHEAVGVVRDGAMAGQRVAINPLMTCGHCPACLGGDEHLCPEREMIGMRVPGGFAEQVAIKQANLTVLPDHLSFENAALAEPLACTIHAARLIDIEATDRNVTILGGGAIGLMAALVFRHYGFSAIRIAETNPLRRALLEQLGAFDCYDPLATDPGASSTAIVFDAVGSHHTRAAASMMVQPGGDIIHIGLQDSDGGLDTRRLTLQEIRLHGSYCYRRRDFAEALKLLADGVISGQGWADIRPLDEGGEAFRAVHEGRGQPKIILSTSA